MARLHHLAEVNPATPEFDWIPPDTLVPFLPLEAVWPGDMLDVSRRRPRGEVSVGYTRFREGDILIPKITPTFQADRTVIASGIEGDIGAGTTELHLVRVGNLADRRYVRYLLSSKPVLSEGEASMVGVAGQKRVPDDYFRNIRVPVTDLTEQRTIANYLDAETARIDALIAKRRRMIALLDERAQVVVGAVCPGPIIYRSDGRPAGVEGVRCVRLGALALIQSGFTMDSRRDAGVDSVTLPYLRVANVQDGSLSLDDVKEVTVPRELAQRCTLRPGDVLMTEGGDPDKLARGTVWSGVIEPCLHQNAVFAVRPDARLTSEYLAFVTRTSYARSYFEMTASKATGIAHTSSTKIAGFCVPLPSVAEQRRIVRLVSERLNGIDGLRSRLARQVSLLVERRQALITAAVSGELDVPGAWA